MQEQRFKVCVGGGEILARDMSMDSLLLFVEAFFNKYNAEDELTIMREEQDGNAEENW